MKITEMFLNVALLGAEWVMYILVALSVLSLSIIIERIVYFAKTKGDFSQFIKELTERFSAKETPGAISAWCSGQPMLEAKVAAVGLDNSSIKIAEDSMIAAMISGRTQMDKGLVVLGTLGNNAPFVGLFGTIIGIIQAFDALASNDSQGPAVVMAAISEALVATAVGLLVAIPAVVAYNWFLRLIKLRIANSETISKMVTSYVDSFQTKTA